MAYSNRFWRTLPNSNALSYVGSAVAYTTDATYKEFVANSANGEVGIYNADTFALLAGLSGSPLAADDIDAGVRFFFAVNRGGTIEISPIFTKGVAVITKTAYVAPVKAVWTIVTSGTLAAGDILEVSIIDQTTAFVPYPTMRYQYVVPAAGSTLTDGITALAAIINSTTTPPNRGGNKLVTAAVVSTDDLQITADYYGSNIKVMTGYKLSDIGTTTNGTKMNLGSGVPAHVQQYQNSSDIMKGVTHLYTNHATAQPADFGLPASNINASGTYVTYQFLHENSEWSPTPVEKHFRKQQVLLFIEDGATDPIAAIDGALGVS